MHAMSNMLPELVTTGSAHGIDAAKADTKVSRQRDVSSSKMEILMKGLAVLSFVAAFTGTVSANDQVLVDPDFGLTFETPDSFEADLVGQTPEGLVLITVSTTDPALPAVDPGGNICEITFQYDPAYGRGDQDWVNSLFEETGAYEQMADTVPVPGTTESGEDFIHRGSASYRVYGQHEQGGPFTVATIPTPMGFALLTCASSNAEIDWTSVDPIIDAVTVPGQNRDHLVADGPCEADTDALFALLDGTRIGSLDRSTIAALDGSRKDIAETCGGVHADAILDQAVAKAGHKGTYRDLRYKALAQIGSDLLTDEQHAALDGGREQVVALNDEATGDRYVQYMHFIVGLRSPG